MRKKEQVPRVRHQSVIEWWLRESAAGIYQGTKRAPSETAISDRMVAA